MDNRVLAFVIDSAIIGIPIFILYFIAAALYFIHLAGSTGQTPGKKAMGVKIVDAVSGQPIGFGRALGRYLVQALCDVVVYAGLWSASPDSNTGRYQGWHDKALNTQVISVK
jgi:uncharacterized RDD family membrane protein YckC